MSCWAPPAGCPTDNLKRSVVLLHEDQGLVKAHRALLRLANNET